MLKIRNVTKSYRTKQVLNGVTFDVSKGEIKGLIGVNGAGKSTLIEIVCGVKKLDKGEVFINDMSISLKRNKNKIKQLIGYMPQSFSLFNDLTVEENLGYLCAVYGLNRSVIHEIINKCELNNHRKTMAKNLSGGYKQLLSMAAAIIHNPKLLILDEPTSAMDPLFRRRFWKIVDSCKRNGATVLVITHHIEELIECDSFVCLSRGKVSIDGTLDAFKKEGLLNIEELLNKFTIEG